MQVIWEAAFGQVQTAGSVPDIGIAIWTSRNETDSSQLISTEF
jgi:hypothetical protein